MNASLWLQNIYIRWGWVLEGHILFISPVEANYKTKLWQCPAGIKDVSINVSQKGWELLQQQRSDWSVNFEQQEASFCFTSLPLVPISPQGIYPSETVSETQPCNTLKARGSPCCLVVP